MRLGGGWWVSLRIQIRGISRRNSEWNNILAKMASIEEQASRSPQVSASNTHVSLPLPPNASPIVKAAQSTVTAKLDSDNSDDINTNSSSSNLIINTATNTNTTATFKNNTNTDTSVEVEVDVSIHPLLLSVLSSLGRSDKFLETSEYLKGEWFLTEQDLFHAVADGPVWDSLRLPARLKLALKDALQNKLAQQALKKASSATATAAVSATVDTISVTTASTDGRMPLFVNTDAGADTSVYCPSTPISTTTGLCIGDRNVMLESGLADVAGDGEKQGDIECMLSEQEQEQEREHEHEQEQEHQLHWIRCFSPEHKTFYFYHEETQETTWEVPTGVSPDDIKEDAWSAEQALALSEKLARETHEEWNGSNQRHEQEEQEYPFICGTYGMSYPLHPSLFPVPSAPEMPLHRTSADHWDIAESSNEGGTEGEAGNLYSYVSPVSLQTPSSATCTGTDEGISVPTATAVHAWKSDVDVASMDVAEGVAAVVAVVDADAETITSSDEDDDDDDYTDSLPRARTDMGPGTGTTSAHLNDGFDFAAFSDSYACEGETDRLGLNDDDYEAEWPGVGDSCVEGDVEGLISDVGNAEETRGLREADFQAFLVAEAAHVKDQKLARRAAARERSAAGGADTGLGIAGWFRYSSPSPSSVSCKSDVTRTAGTAAATATGSAAVDAGVVTYHTLLDMGFSKESAQEASLKHGSDLTQASMMCLWAEGEGKQEQGQGQSQGQLSEAKQKSSSKLSALYTPHPPSASASAAASPVTSSVTTSTATAGVSHMFGKGGVSRTSPKAQHGPSAKTPTSLSPSVGAAPAQLVGTGTGTGREYVSYTASDLTGLGTGAGGDGAEGKKSKSLGARIGRLFR